MKPITFWKKQSPTLESMYLRADVSHVDTLERQEILSLLPSFENKLVLDLGAGIGRFTKEFAKKAEQVTAVDAIEKFTQANREYNRSFQNIVYCTANVMDLLLHEKSYDFIFINWLFMYLEDAEVETLALRLKFWLKPGGILFFRESCAATHTLKKEVYPVHYRSLSFYHRILDPLFTLLDSGSIQTHIDHYANPFQCYWLYKKSG